MGFIIIGSILATYIAAQRYTEPEVAALVVLIVAGILFVIGHVIIKSFERIAEASRAKSEFVSIASHQLRGPLTSIKWQMEILLKNQTRTIQEKSYLETINENNNQMIKLVNDLLEVNRIENNLMVLTPSPISLVDITKRAINGYDLYAKSARLTFTLEAAPSLPMVYADDMRIRWVIENIIDNAVRYSNAETVVDITIKPENKFLLWSITNTGTPIAPEDERHLFTKFFRAESAVKLRTEGSGLGLFVAKSIVEATGGHIGYLPSPGKTTFWFTVPLAP